MAKDAKCDARDRRSYNTYCTLDANHTHLQILADALPRYTRRPLNLPMYDTSP